MQEFLDDERSKVKEINRLYSKIIQRLNSQHQCHIEDLLLKHKQQIIRLETINYDYCRFIGELLSAKENPRKEDAKQSSLKKEFLISKNNRDGRKKIFDTESVMLQSTSSSKSNFESLD